MTYEKFIEQSIERQLAVIQREKARMRKADALWLEYAAAMGKLNLHPLTFLEIGDRRAQLEIMQRNVHETHGCTETMRVLYEARYEESTTKGRKRRRSP